MGYVQSLLSTVVIASLISCGAARSQEPAATPVASSEAAPEPLTDEELRVLVARIALYPDELVAVISAASLFPLQIVEAQRFLEARAKNDKLEPKKSWDGSIVSLLNYPQVVKMMSDDLDWTQSLGSALANQQKDVLLAIQDLRDEAVAKNVIKTDDKIKVTTEQDNVVITAANPEKIYVPQYPPEMFYEPGYVAEPIGYYPEPYPNYFWPTATFFAGAVTGAIWAGAVDWDDWGVWGGDWDGNVDIDCRDCFNNRSFDGNYNIKRGDWANIDRSKINFDRNQFANVDRNQIKQKLEANGRNNIKDKAADIRRDGPVARQGGAGKVKDVRKSTLDGLKANQRPANRPKAGTRPTGSDRPKTANRPSGKPKPGGRVDNRPRNPSGLGDVRSSRSTKQYSNRGAQARGGGMNGRPPQFNRGGGRPPGMHRGGGGRPQMHGGGRRMPHGGGRGGGRGGGGRRR